jgi:4-amino-4-deoxy-L-arabinose transferase-like glycosyltransferase
MLAHVVKLGPADMWAAVKRHALVIAYIAALIPALAMALAQPVWSRIDEAPNADFIVQLGHGVYPVADTTLLAPETISVLKAEGFFSPLYPSATGDVAGPPPDPRDTGPIPPGMSGHANAVWMARHIWELSRESDQTPLYYLLMTPIWSAADHVGGPYAAIYAIRVIGALIIATVAPMAVAIARMIAPPRQEIAALTAVFAILLPGLDLNGTRISNDVLATAVGGLIVLLAVRWAASRWTWRRALLMGLAMGAGLLVKLTLAGLFPALALSALWPAAGTTWRGRLARLAVSSAIAVGCLVPWFVLNLHLYGGITPGARALRLEDGLPGSLTSGFVVADVATFLVTWWSGEPWGTLPLALPFVLLGVLIALMAPVAAINLLRNQARSIVPGRFVAAGAAVLGMTAAALTLPATSQFEFVGHGRFAYPAVSAAAVLWALGLSAVLTRASIRRSVAAAYALVVVAMLAVGAANFHAQPRLEPGPGVPSAEAKMVSVNASGQLDGVTINVDDIAFDYGAEVTWFEVTASNRSQAKVDWPVVPFASNEGAPLNVDYLRSTHMPGDIDAGQSVTGWLRVDLDPARVHASDDVLLRFPDVAVDDYRTVADIDVRVILNQPANQADQAFSTPAQEARTA